MYLILSLNLNVRCLSLIEVQFPFLFSSVKSCFNVVFVLFCALLLFLGVAVCSVPHVSDYRF